MLKFMSAVIVQTQQMQLIKTENHWNIPEVCCIALLLGLMLWELERLVGERPTGLCRGDCLYMLCACYCLCLRNKKGTSRRAPFVSG